MCNRYIIYPETNPFDEEEISNEAYKILIDNRFLQPTYLRNHIIYQKYRDLRLKTDDPLEKCVEEIHKEYQHLQYGTIASICRMPQFAQKCKKYYKHKEKRDKKLKFKL